MTQLGEAEVVIRAVTDKLDRDLAGARGAVEKAMGGIEKSMKAIGGLALGGAIAGIAGLAAGIGLALSEAMDAQAIMAQTEAVIKSTGGAAGMTADQIGDLATALSTQSRFSDDAIQTGENLLLTFTNIGKDTFPAATQAMVDMAAAMGTDVSGGAIQLGKALNDPVAGISALSRVGVTFTEDQKKVIKALVATGDVAGAQAVILAELNKEFGGSAAAAAETFAGKMDVLKNKLLNVAEGLGMVLLPILTVVFDHVAAVVLPIIEDVVAALGNFFEGLATGEDIGGDFANLAWELATALGATKEQAAAVFTSVRELADGFMLLVAQLGEVVDQVKPYLETAAQWLAANVSLQDVLIALGVAIAFVVIPAIASVVAAAAPVIIAFVAVIAVAALLRHAWEENWGGIQEKTAAAWAFIQPLLLQAKEWLQVNIPAALAALRAFWDANWPIIQATVETAMARVQAVISTVLPIVQGIIQTVLGGILAFWAAHGESIITIVTTMFNNFRTTVGTVLSVVRGVIETVLGGIKVFWDAWGETIMTVVGNMATGIGAIFDAFAAAFRGDWSAFGEALRVLWDAMWANIILIVTNAIDQIKGVDWGAIGKAIIDGISAGIRNAAGMLAEAARSAASAAFEAAKAFLGIHSPSTLFAGVGENMMQGLAGGIKGNAGLAADAMLGALAAPVFDLGRLIPVSGLVGEDSGPAQSLTYSSTTTVHTNRDPMPILRASRHLDKLGALAT